MSRLVWAICLLILVIAYGLVLVPAMFHNAGQKSQSIQKIDPNSAPAKLQDAILDDDVKKCKRLIQENPQLLTGCDYIMPLHLSALLSTPELMKTFIELGADVNARDSGGSTPLHSAAHSGVIEKVEILLAHGADVNAKTKEFFPGDSIKTPLTSAVESGNPKVVELLFDKGAAFVRTELEYLQSKLDSRKGLYSNLSPKEVDEQKKYAEEMREFWPSDADLAEIVAILKKHGVDVLRPDARGRTPLHTVAWSGQVDVIKELLTDGSLINAKDALGRTPLHQAVAGNNPEMVAFLLSQGADVNAQDSVGQTPLHETAHCPGVGQPPSKTYGSTNVLNILMANGADVDRVDIQGWTPLLHSIYYVNNGVADALKKHGANINTKTNDGFSADSIRRVHDYFCAVAKGETAQIEAHLNDMPELLNAYCIVEETELSDRVWADRKFPDLKYTEKPARDVSFWDMFFRSTDDIIKDRDAKYSEREQVEDLFWEMNPDTTEDSTFSGSSWTALHQAILAQDTKMVEMLLSRKADVNVKTLGGGLTPLHIACLNHSSMMVEQLLNAGADVNAVTDRGNTPLHLAAQYLDGLDVVKVLVERNADLDAKNKDGLIPLECAQKSNERRSDREEIVEFLIKVAR